MEQSRDETLAVKLSVFLTFSFHFTAEWFMDSSKQTDWSIMKNAHRARGFRARGEKTHILFINILLRGIKTFLNDKKSSLNIPMSARDNADTQRGGQNVLKKRLSGGVSTDDGCSQTDVTDGGSWKKRWGLITYIHLQKWKDKKWVPFRGGAGLPLPPGLSLNTPRLLHEQINYSLIQAFPKTDPAAIILWRPEPYFKRANDHFEHFLSLFQSHLLFSCDATARKSCFSSFQYVLRFERTFPSREYFNIQEIVLIRFVAWRLFCSSLRSLTSAVRVTTLTLRCY